MAAAAPSRPARSVVIAALFEAIEAKTGQRPVEDWDHPGTWTHPCLSCGAPARLLDQPGRGKLLPLCSGHDGVLPACSFDAQRVAIKWNPEQFEYDDPDPILVSGAELYGDVSLNGATPAAATATVGPAPTAPASRFRFWTVADYLDRPRPPELVEGLLIEGGASAVVGAAESCKTFVALGLAAAYSLGLPWCDRATSGGPVAYLIGEGQGWFGYRLEALIKTLGRPLERLFILDDMPALADWEQVVAVTNALLDLPDRPKLVVVDTLATAAVGADENSARDMGTFMAHVGRIRAETGAHVMLLHHPSLAGRIRGSTAIPGAIDSQIDVSRDGSVVTLACGKSKDLPPWEPITLVTRRVDLDGGRSSLVLDVASGVSADRLSEVQQRVYALLANSVAAGEGLTATRWEQLADEAKIGRAAFYRARKTLVEAGRVRREGGQRGAVYSPSEGINRQTTNGTPASSLFANQGISGQAGVFVPESITVSEGITKVSETFGGLVGEGIKVSPLLSGDTLIPSPTPAGPDSDDEHAF